MQFVSVIWDLEDDPEGNVQHIAQHGVTPQEVDEVIASASIETTSDATGRPMLFGSTRSGRYLAVVYDRIDAVTIIPVTAYDVREPQ